MAGVTSGDTRQPTHWIIQTKGRRRVISDSNAIPWGESRLTDRLYDAEIANAEPQGPTKRLTIPICPIGQSAEEWLLSGRSGNGVRVCVIDSGIDFEHPAVRNSGESFVLRSSGAGGRTVVPGAPGDPTGHGTACASIIGAVAPSTRVDSVRVLGRHNVGPAADFLRALEWAVAQGYDIVHLSLSTPRPEHRRVLLEIADRAASFGVLLVCAASNSAVVSFPWALASVISVGSHRSADPFEVRMNPDPPVDFFAGGIRVPVRWRDGTLREVSGNSFAASAVVAKLARIVEAQPDLRPWQYKHLLSLLATNAESMDNVAAQRKLEC